MDNNLNYIDRLAKEKLSDFKLDPQFSWKQFSGTYAAQEFGHTLLTKNKTGIATSFPKPLSFFVLIGVVSLVILYFIRPFSAADEDLLPSAQTNQQLHAQKPLQYFLIKTVYISAGSIDNDNIQIVDPKNNVNVYDNSSHTQNKQTDTPNTLVVVKETVYITDTIKITDTINIYQSGTDSARIKQKKGHSPKDNSP